MPLEVLVLGGGPAGSTAARLLALLGHDVRLVTSPVPGPSLAESIPPSCGKLFDVLGVREAVDAAAFVRSGGNTVSWGERELRVEPFGAGERGWQVTADALEPILRQAAVAGGARLEMQKVSAAEVERTTAAFVLDCTGRSGLLARRADWRIYEPDRRTVALVGQWQRTQPWPIPDPTHTLIESYGDGWVWSVPLDITRRFVAVMVDPRVSRLSKGESPRAVYLLEIAKTGQFRAMLDEATLIGGPWGWDASMYYASRYTTDNVLLVGDAGSFVDPLSSAGVQKALASGWLAAITVHTALVRPAMRETAVTFFAEREAEMYNALRTTTNRFLAGAATRHPQPFWTIRMHGPEATAVDDLSSDALRSDRDVNDAFQRLRQAPALEVRRGDHVCIEPQPAISGSEIVLEPRLVTADRRPGVRYLRDVDLVALVELAPSVSQVADLFEQYQRRCGPVVITDLLAALSVALAKRWLVWNHEPRNPEPRNLGT